MVMPQKNNGYVLLVVLIFLQLFGLLCAQSISRVSRTKREAVEGRQIHQLRDSAAVLLAELDKHDKSVCQRETISPHFIQRQSLAWWQAHACRASSQDGEYYYFHERLMTDECAVIDGEDGYATQYYRTTLFYPTSWTVMVQDVTVLPDTRPLSCSTQPRQLRPGRQMLRWLR